MDKLSIVLNFHGFYNTIHDEMIDDSLEQMICDDHGDIPVINGESASELLHNVTDYEKIYNEYSKEFVNNLNYYIKEKTNFNPLLEFETLISPREYNFENGRIFAFIPKSSLLKIASEVNFECLQQVIKDRFESRSGFLSFYSGNIHDWLDIPLNKMDHNQLSALFSAWIMSNEDLSEYSEDNFVYEYINDDLGIQEIICNSGQSEDFLSIIDQCYAINYES